ncbi:PRD domain-containing protein [Oenococcus oeni]|uniref:PRD domain-containing protein n=1 Tax=Oenococcus oeni TaxID=1247 RepID=UPI0027E3AD32|nr:PRD domain-containing protein [Oenococcus oeni]
MAGYRKRIDCTHGSLQEIKLPGRKLLQQQLMFHLPAMVLRLQKGLIVRNPLLGDIKAQYPELFGMTWYTGSGANFPR